MPDQQTDMVPPWEMFPTYERYTIGWRMGTGEQYRYEWHDFISKLPKDYASRLAYLRRHRPAPLNWGEAVLAVLYPKARPSRNRDCSPKETRKLLELGLVEQDVAYHTWLAQQSAIAWPWLLSVAETPEEAARYRTREFWFFSRQLSAARRLGECKIDSVPAGWQSVESELRTGCLGDIDLSHGLQALARMLCAGTLQAPWELSPTLDNFADSFEMDMGYTDAFRLWLMCAFDDGLLLGQMFPTTGIPGDWAAWLKEQANSFINHG